MNMRIFLLAPALLPLGAATKPPAWTGYAGNPQHTAAAPAAGQALARVRWSRPVDLMPQRTGGELFIHYASPMLTGADLLLLPVKTGAAGGYEVQAIIPATGAVQWTLTTDYVLPTATWTPSFPAALTNQNRTYIAAAGGTVLMRAATAGGTAQVRRLAFYGLDIYQAHKSTMTATVMIDTPITADKAGNIYFGFVVTGANPAKLTSGIARIAANGAGTWVAAGAAAADTSITQVAMNCAPALAADGATLYIAVSNGSAGYLLGLDTATLATKYRAALNDPASGQVAWITDLSTASPTIGPDGDVYYGVLENPFPSHNNRGWLLHFDATLARVKTPGSFGWDDTVSLVPAALIPVYKASGSYLLMSKYNNYYGIGHGDGDNRIAILDPGATQRDEYSTSLVTVMKEVQTALGPTEAPNGHGVYEWCINTAVVDAATGTVFAGSEDGKLYGWDLATNILSQSLQLNAPQGEAYTPSVIGPDGTVYAINNATLYAIGNVARK